MTTVQRATQTSQPVSLGGTIPGDAATGHLIRDVRRFVESLVPEETPLLSAIKKDSSGNYRRGNQYKLEWGSEANLPHTAILEGAINTAVTTINVEAGQGARFQKYMKIAVYDLDVNGLPNYSTKEEMWISAEPSTDALTVVRGRGTTSGTAFADGARIEIIGTALPEGQDFTIAPIVYGDFLFNYYQTFEKSSKVTFEGDKTPNMEYPAGEMARQMRKKTMRMKFELEKALIQASKNAGTLATPVPSEMGGFPGFIPSANKTNAGGNKIGPYDIETAGAALWDSVGAAGAKKLIASMRTVRFFDGLFNKYREARMDDTSVNLQFTEFRTRTGNYQIMPVRNVPEGVLWGASLDNLALVFYEGMGWQEKEHATDGPYRQRSVFGKCTLMVESPETMFEISNFDTNLDNYGRVF